MNKKWICILLAVLLLCGAVTACAPAETTPTDLSGASSKYETTLHYSLAVYPVDELLDYDSTVVRVTFTGIEKAIDLNRTTSAGYEKRMVHTYFNVDVKETFMGEKQDKMTIIQLGGETETQIVKVNELPLPEIGDEWIFFLWTIEDLPMLYRFPIKDGKVTVNKTELPELFEKDGKDVNGKKIPVEEFENILRAKIAAKKN